MKYLAGLVSENMAACHSVLDVGCGRSTFLRNVKRPPVTVGMDIHMPYLIKSRSSGLHDAYVAADCLKIPFRPRSFDCVIAVEVIEHLSKESGSALIEEMERVSRGVVMLTTPNGFLDAAPGPDDNPDEKHLSGWSARDFTRRGFRVYGISGCRLFRERKGVFKLLPGGAHFLLRSLAARAAYHIPQTAFQLFCVKPKFCNRNSLQNLG